MFRKLITMSIRSNMYNRRTFSSCNNRCKVDDVTNNLIRQERYLTNINAKIDILAIMSVTNVLFSFFLTF